MFYSWEIADMLFQITKGMPDHTHLKGLNKTATFLDA